MSRQVYKVLCGSFTLSFPETPDRRLANTKKIFPPSPSTMEHAGSALSHQFGVLSSDDPSSG